MIPTRGGDQAACGGFAFEEIFCVDDGGARLERADGRVVFVLHPDFRAEAFAEQWPTILGRRLHQAVNEVRGRSHFIQNWQTCRGLSDAHRSTSCTEVPYLYRCLDC